MKLANFHFWIATLGIIFWTVPMYWAGFTQSLNWSRFNPDGTLVFGNFLETVLAIKNMYILRSLGGALYLVGALVMGYNLIATARKGKLLKEEEAEAPALENTSYGHGSEHWHRKIERRPIQLLVFSLIVILIGGIVELIPTFFIKSNVPTIASVKPYTPLELEGRDIYIREGCVSCHSQMVRPFRHEVVRYKGEYSKSGEFVYDHPFLWGSKRTGPDLHRLGGKYPDSWHYHHMAEPGKISTGSLMPAYPWLFTKQTKMEDIPAKIRGMQKLGVPYPEGYDQLAVEHAKLQAKGIADNLLKDDLVVYDMAERNVETLEDKEIVALIAYLQRLGTDIKVKAEPAAEAKTVTK